MPDHIESEGFTPTDYGEGVGPPPDNAPTPFEVSEGAHATFAHASDTTALFSEGAVIAEQFEVIRVLGRGGMGVVYEVTDRLTQQRLALKTILPTVLGNPEAIERFVQEVNTARRLRHPGIVGVYDVRQVGPLLFFTMEYVEGRTLRSVLEERGMLPPPEAFHIVRQLCDALGYAHNITVHCDISPENVMVLNDGTVRLLDFGIARVMDIPSDSSPQRSLGKTHYV
ncbi:MAG: serine/threonine protein kinase, partial [bacterium]|nr:serine/threonine protein kinase [bacterium]